MSKLSALHARIKACTICPLRKGCKQVVPGVGPETARIMLIGEAPGAREDELGEPFVGPAGKFLDHLLGLAGLERSEVYITNVVKCRPPGNRDPSPAELEACKFHLDEQLELLQPQVIITLGRFSMARWFAGASISKIHGQARRFGKTLVVPMFHPAAALHQPKYKDLIEADFRALPGIIKDAKKVTPGKPAKGDSKQLSMF